MTDEARRPGQPPCTSSGTAQGEVRAAGICSGYRGGADHAPRTAPRRRELSPRPYTAGATGLLNALNGRGVDRIQAYAGQGFQAATR
jgi:hypothetical protein